MNWNDDDYALNLDYIPTDSSENEFGTVSGGESSLRRSSRKSTRRRRYVNYQEEDNESTFATTVAPGRLEGFGGKQHESTFATTVAPGRLEGFRGKQHKEEGFEKEEKKSSSERSSGGKQHETEELEEKEEKSGEESFKEKDLDENELASFREAIEDVLDGNDVNWRNREIDNSTTISQRKVHSSRSTKPLRFKNIDILRRRLKKIRLNKLQQLYLNYFVPLKKRIRRKGKRLKRRVGRLGVLKKAALILFLTEKYFDLATSEEKRVTEKSNIGELEDKELTNCFFSLCGVEIAPELVDILLSYLDFNSSLLFSLGMTNSNWYLLLLSAWKGEVVVSRGNVRQISLLILRNCVCLNIDYSKGLITVGELDYLFKNLGNGGRNIEVLRFSHGSIKPFAMTNLKRIFKIVTRNKVVFSRCRRVEFPKAIAMPQSRYPGRRSGFYGVVPVDQGKKKKKRKLKKEYEMDQFVKVFPSVESVKSSESLFGLFDDVFPDEKWEWNNGGFWNCRHLTSLELIRQQVSKFSGRFYDGYRMIQLNPHTICRVENITSLTIDLVMPKRSDVPKEEKHRFWNNFPNLEKLKILCFEHERNELRLNYSGDEQKVTSFAFDFGKLKKLKVLETEFSITRENEILYSLVLPSQLMKKKEKEKKKKRNGLETLKLLGLDGRNIVTSLMDFLKLNYIVREKKSGEEIILHNLRVVEIGFVDNVAEKKRFYFFQERTEEQLKNLNGTATRIMVDESEMQDILRLLCDLTEKRLTIGVKSSFGTSKIICNFYTGKLWMSHSNHFYDKSRLARNSLEKLKKLSPVMDTSLKCLKTFCKILKTKIQEGKWKWLKTVVVHSISSKKTEKQPFVQIPSNFVMKHSTIDKCENNGWEHRFEYHLDEEKKHK